MSEHQNQSQPIVIIGSGLAGYTVIRELRKLDKDVPITLITREPGYFYSKPMLSTAFANSKLAEQLISSSSEAMATQLNLTVLGNTHVHSIDAQARLLHTSNGEVTYSKLVLALGADQIQLDLQGTAADAVMTVNDLEDYARFRQAIDGHKRVAILGAGLIGCEFANDLTLGGYSIDVIDLAAHALGRLLPEAAATALEEKLSAAGVRWHFASTAQSIDAHGDAIRITLVNGDTIDTDVVLSAVGLRPRTQLARDAGIKTGLGIEVNRQLQTNLDSIYAIGDCAETEGLVLPYVMPIMQAARALAPTLLGQAASLQYPAMPVMVKTPAYPIVVSPPAKGAQGQWNSTEVDGGMLCRFESPDGQLLGFALLGSATAERATLVKLLPPVLA
ncbi:MAG: NAD(P)/FAD-dependent oxidoreductase [Polynucleobacter sp.]